MSQHDFIFSNHVRHRIARHAAFWFACYIFYLITFYIPHCVFPAYNMEKFTANASRLGLSRWIWWRIFNSVVTFIPLLAFAYIVIYFLLPRHIFSKKNWLVTMAFFIPTLIAVLILQYYSSYLVLWNLARINPGKNIIHPGVIINSIPLYVLFNYPIVTGFAVIIKMIKHGWMKQQETAQIFSEKAKTELQILKGQIHPHFLFNTLNNIYYFALTFPQKAVEMLTKLTGILHYIINECGQHLVPLEKELEMIQDYVALEKIRYGDRLKMVLEINGDFKDKMISPLLLIPLVENSFKHGASKMLEHPWINLNITIDGKVLFILLSNSRPDVRVMEQNSHIGLKNVKKRLELIYPSAHELNIAESTKSFEVFMKIALDETYVLERDVKTINTEYAVA